MPTGYTHLIISGDVKTPKEFLHLCLRNFGVCQYMRDLPLTNQDDYTTYIKDVFQKSIDYHTTCLEAAKSEYVRIMYLSDDDLYGEYVKKFTEEHKYCQDALKDANQINAKYQHFYDKIDSWKCSDEFNSVKDFALNQINISKESTDYYEKKLSKKMLTKEEFISTSKYEDDILNNTKHDIEYHQKRLDENVERMNKALAFYEQFKKEIENL